MSIRFPGLDALFRVFFACAIFAGLLRTTDYPWQDVSIAVASRIGAASATIPLVFVAVDPQFLDAGMPEALQFDTWVTLIDRITASGPRAVLLDVHWSDRRFESLVPGGASRLEAAIARAADRAVVVAGLPGRAVAGSDAGSTQGEKPLKGIQENTQVFKGCMLLVVDEDHVSRRVRHTDPLCSPLGPSPLSMAAARQLGVQLQSVGLLLPERTSAQSVQTVSASQLIRSPEDQPVWRDAVVVIGPNYPFEDDVFSSFFSDGLFSHHALKGAVVHGLQLTALLNQRVAWERIDGLLPWGALLALGLSAWSLMKRQHASLLLLAAALVLLFDLISTVHFRVWQNLHWVAFLLLASSVSLSAERLVRSLIEKRQIRRLLGGLLSPSVLQKCLADPDWFFSTHRCRQATILVLDIKGFTQEAATVDATTLFLRANEFLGMATRLIHAHQGCVERYRGDGFLAFFGAPLETSMHSADALAAARDILRAVECSANPDIQRFRQRLRIGISTGEIVLGQVGDSHRYDIAVTGMAANRAAHFESMADVSRFPIVSDQTTVGLAGLGDAFECLPDRHPKHPALTLMGGPAPGWR